MAAAPPGSLLGLALAAAAAAAAAAGAGTRTTPPRGGSRIHHEQTVRGGGCSPTLTPTPTAGMGT